MALSRHRASLASWLLTIFAALSFMLPASALHFYMDSTNAKCFYEELPKDTLVVGHYSTEQYNEATGKYEANENVGIHITVDEVFDNNHRVVSNKGASKGRFGFTAADSGDHRLCFLPLNAVQHTGWLSSGHSVGAIKFTLDLAIGETSDIESNDKSKMDDIVQKVRDLNGRLQDIRREQVFQREREAEFRDQSETTNARVVRWTLIQLAVLGITCAWQLSHLRSFFIKQKLT